ncbi:MAG: glycoside hydrolase family 15 protein [Granulicella sp.]
MDKGIEEHEETRPKTPKRAKGKPGAKPRWTSGAKTLVGTAASSRSRIWYTIGNGILNEIYFPDVDQANTRSVRFLVTDASGFFSDEEWDATHEVQWLETGIPSCKIQTRCKLGKYTLEKEIITDPIRDTLMMRIHFRPSVPGLRLYLFVDVHMGDRGADNSAWVGTYKGEKLLIAIRGRTCLAAMSKPPLLESSCGYIGKSDGFTLLSHHQPLPESDVAMDGNVAITGEIDYAASEGKFIVSLACGSHPAEAAQQARAGVLQDFDTTRELFARHWKDDQEKYDDVADLSGEPLDMYRVSTAVLETHQSKRFPGGFVASLSLPWGFARSDDDVGGYHVLWPRDAVETAMGKLASGDAGSARSTLFYLTCTQDEHGGWSQNMWLDGTAHWGAIQMDGMALPILLADKLRREQALDGYDPAPMVRRASRFLLQHGPFTQQDRWETMPGYSPYTMAAEVAALLAAADFEETGGELSKAEFLRSTADAWNDSIDEFTYVEGTALAKKHTIDGYYVRMMPPERVSVETGEGLTLKMPNQPAGSKIHRATDIVSPDAIALVRFGLRSAADPRITNTVKLLDATLKRDTKTGPVWTRSTRDGYGEKVDGSPFDKSGVGRGWPLLAGERAHYEIAAGNVDFALELLKTMARQTSSCGMIPEQVWDAKDIPEKLLFNGHPTGSGMPLAWAHSEYIKLLRSLHSKKVWDMPPQPVQRYQVERTTCPFQIWTPDQQRGWIDSGKDLRVDLSEAASVAWVVDGKSSVEETVDSGLGIHFAIVPTKTLWGVASVDCTVRFAAQSRKNKDISFTVRVR